MGRLPKDVSTLDLPQKPGMDHALVFLGFGGVECASARAGMPEQRTKPSEERAGCPRRTSPETKNVHPRAPHGTPHRAKAALFLLQRRWQTTKKRRAPVVRGTLVVM